MWMSRSAGTFASTRSRNLRMCRARWRGKHLPMISPVAMSRAAKREVVPWRLVVAAPLRLPGAPSARAAGNASRAWIWLFSATQSQGTMPAAPNTADDVDPTYLHEELDFDMVDGPKCGRRRPARCASTWSRARGRSPGHRAKAPIRANSSSVSRTRLPRWRFTSPISRRAGAGFVADRRGPASAA